MGRRPLPSPQLLAYRASYERRGLVQSMKSKLLKLVVAIGVVLVALVGVFVWGYFQPKPSGFAPTNPDEGAFITEQWTRYTIDAANREEWTFFNFGAGRAIDATLSANSWDLAFKRTDLLTNSGATNSSGFGGVVDLGEVPLEEAIVPNTALFLLDEVDDEQELSNPAIGDWYNYSFITHTVRAKDNTYLLRTGSDRDVLLQFDSYYCENEDPGCITFRYRLIPATQE